MKIIDWNIQNRSADDWPARRESLAAILRSEPPDVLCVQEAWIEQVEFLAGLLGEHDRTGIGRDDAKDEGEHCAIFYKRGCFERLAGETFWLSDTPEKPGITWQCDHNRICTWCRLGGRDGGEFFVCNTHFPLTESAREKSAALVAERIGAIAAGAPVILAGDFNCIPGSGPWSALEDAGLASAAAGAGQPGHAPTFHNAGGEGACIDAIFVSEHWRVEEFRLLTDKGGVVYPSDHFALCVEVRL